MSNEKSTLPVIIVTGANGQLGSELRFLSQSFSKASFVFVDIEELPLDTLQNADAFFAQHNPQYFIHCAAYTAVDKAEKEPELAHQVNAIAPGLLALSAQKYGARFIHISTDYVFKGDGTMPYKVDYPAQPQNVYGLTKWQGEEEVRKHNSDAIIIRTSWVYSSVGHNFVKTMMRLMSEKETLSVVNDQIGSPTYAADLASIILNPIINDAIEKNSWHSGTYHYTNDGDITWYQFAEGIKKCIGSNCHIMPVTSDQYPTPATRPAYGVLDKSKIVDVYSITLQPWEHSLNRCIALLRKG